jgi:hypothetical protein
VEHIAFDDDAEEVTYKPAKVHLETARQRTGRTGSSKNDGQASAIQDLATEDNTNETANQPTKRTIARSAHRPS